MSQRPFKILGLQQVAIGGAQKQTLRALWVDLLGLEPTGSYRSEAENVDEDILALGSGALTVEVDLMQPLNADRKPAVDKPPLNHIGLWVDDLPAAASAGCTRPSVSSLNTSRQAIWWVSSAGCVWRVRFSCSSGPESQSSNRLYPRTSAARSYNARATG